MVHMEEEDGIDRLQWWHPASAMTVFHCIWKQIEVRKGMEGDTSEMNSWMDKIKKTNVRQ